MQIKIKIMKKQFLHIATGDIWTECTTPAYKGLLYNNNGDRIPIEYAKSKDWKEITPEYTILTLWSQSYDNKYENNKCLASYDKAEIGSYDRPLNKIYPTRENWLQYFHPPLWNIYAVRRESDGEIFTVGDNIEIPALSGKIELYLETITGFKIDGNKMCVVISKEPPHEMPYLHAIKKAKPKEWEITAFYNHVAHPTPTPFYSKETEVFNVAYNELINNKNSDRFAIYSIKRLSDETEFKIGDKITGTYSIDENPKFGPGYVAIESFEICDGDLIVNITTGQAHITPERKKSTKPFSG